MNKKEEFLQACIAQEQKYQFDFFSRDDVWELGCDLVEATRSFEGPLAVEIDLNGVMVFRYYPAGTCAYHEQWLQRKRRTVCLTEKSSLRVFAELDAKGASMQQEMLLDPKDYANCGGGFPIRLRGGCMIGFIGVSGLEHTRDHAALLAGLDRFFARRQQTRA